MTEQIIHIDGVDYAVLRELPPGLNSSNNKGCVLLVHALMSNRHMWDNTVRVLHEAGYSTLRYDHIGHNMTPAPGTQGSFHMDDLTRHAHELVRQATGQSRVKAVLGCSIGGVLALRYAMLFGDDVECVVAMCAPGMTPPEAAKALWGARIEQFEADVQNGGDALCRATVDRWIPGATAHDEAVRREALKHVKTCTLPGYRILADAIRGYDYEHQLGETQWPPTMIIAGSEDTAAPVAMLQDVASRIRGSEFVALDRCGHLPPVHAPENFHKLLMSFLEPDE